MLLSALVGAKFAIVSEVQFNFLAGIGVFLLWLCLTRVFFRTMWFATKMDETTVYDNEPAKNVRRNLFASWFIGINRNQHGVDES